MNHDQILAILYDLALTIGSEVHLRPLLTRTLQRLLYHTGFPTGLAFTGVRRGDDPIVGQLEATVGDFALARRDGERFALPADAVPGGAALVAAGDLSARLGTRRSYHTALCLPVGDDGLILLLSPSAPETPLPLTHIFEPVMNNLARAIVLCRTYEANYAALVAANVEARAGRARMRAALDHLSDLVFLIDPATGRFIDFNQTAERILGRDRESLLQLRPDQMCPEACARMQELWQQAPAQGPAEALVESQLTRADGATFPVEIRFNFMPDAEPPLMIALARDITERKRTEAELRNLNATLELRVQEVLAQIREKDHILIEQSRLAAMGEMVHNIAHQWRQPLNALSLTVSNLKDDFDFGTLTGEQMSDYAQRILRLLQTMSATIDDFRDFFRPDHEAGEFDVGRAVESALFVMEASLRNNQIEVVKTLPTGLRMEGYSNQFAQAVLNLIANAKEAIQGKKIADGRIEIDLRQTDQGGLLTIRDNGGGIPDAVLPRIFEPYFTTKEKGSGIGLYMTKMIIERNHNGRIEARNDGPGARLTIILPALATHP